MEFGRLQINEMLIKKRIENKKKMLWDEGKDMGQHCKEKREEVWEAQNEDAGKGGRGGEGCE